MIIGARVSNAKKQYRCDYCHRIIAPKDIYLRLYGAAERSDPPYTVRYCIHCWHTINLNSTDGKVIIMALNKANITFTINESGYIEGELWGKL